MSDEAGSKDWNITLFDLHLSVPDQPLNNPPSPPGGMPRRYLDYRPWKGETSPTSSPGVVSSPAPMT